MSGEQNRRSFLKGMIAIGGAAAGTGSAGSAWGATASRLGDLHAAHPLGMPIACQTYPVRALIAEDFLGTMKQLSAAGFRAIELCSPVGYATSGFSVLDRYKGRELNRVLGEHGLRTESSHFSMRELRENLQGRIAWAADVGLTQMLVPTLGGPQQPTVDDVKRAADEFNKMAEQITRAGMRAGIHNEGFELSTVAGKRTYDILIESSDPRYVGFQFQVSTIGRGYDAADYFMRYPGRFFSMHVQGWSSETRATTAVPGTLDFQRIFKAARTGGLRNYFVEMNLELMKASVPYLRALEVDTI